MNASSALKKLARRLLATTCLTAATIGAAGAATVTESTDFGNTFGTASVLPAGTDQVLGAAGGTSGSENVDFFKFTGLLPGSAYTFSGSYIAAGNDPLNVGVLNSAQSFLNSLQNRPATFGGIVPSDGMLVVQVSPVCGDSCTVNYDLTLTATSATTGIPEPGTAATAALGLAAAAAFGARRRRSE